MKKYWGVMLFVGVLLIGAIGGIGLISLDQAAKENEKLGEAPVSEKTLSQTSQNPKSHQIAVFNGRGTKNTSTFTIPPQAKEWHITWKTGPDKRRLPGNFMIFIHDAEGRPVSSAANVIGENQDTTVLRRPGSYYLEIIATQPYGIVIWAVY